ARDCAGREAVRAVAETDVGAGETAEGDGFVGVARRDADPAVAAGVDAPAGAGPAGVASTDLAVRRLRRPRHVAPPAEAHVPPLTACPPPGPPRGSSRAAGGGRPERPGEVVRVCDNGKAGAAGPPWRCHEPRPRLEDRVEAGERRERPRGPVARDRGVDEPLV